MINFLKRPNKKKSDSAVNSKWTTLCEKAMTDYRSLTSDERIYFNIKNLINVAREDGLMKYYYYNRDSETIYDTIKDLELLNVPEIALILQKYDELFFRTFAEPKTNGKTNGHAKHNGHQNGYSLKGLEHDFFKQLKPLEKRLKDFADEKI